jgi:hypothetical protein
LNLDVCVRNFLFSYFRLNLKPSRRIQETIFKLFRPSGRPFDAEAGVL